MVTKAVIGEDYDKDNASGKVIDAAFTIINSGGSIESIPLMLELISGPPPLGDDYFLTPWTPWRMAIKTICFLNKLKILDVIIGGWLAMAGFIAMCYFHAEKDKLPEWMPYRRFAYLCIFRSEEHTSELQSH